MAARRSASQGPEYSKSAAARKIEKSISTFSPPSFSSLATAAQYRLPASSSPKNSSWLAAGTPKRNFPPSHGAASSPALGSREYGSDGSNPRATDQTACAPAQSCAKIETQSKLRQAGTT